MTRRRRGSSSVPMRSLAACPAHQGPRRCNIAKVRVFHPPAATCRGSLGSPVVQRLNGIQSSDFALDLDIVFAGSASCRPTSS